MSKRKTFSPGQEVEVQRDVGTPWEPATYREAPSGMRGWHQVRLNPNSPPRWICSMDGGEVTELDRADTMSPRGQMAFATHNCFVPSQRIREVKS